MGMSRSGTSLTTRILNLAGVYLGPEDGLLWHPSNPYGHWERLSMLRFNEWLLKSLGGTWRMPPSMPAGWECSPELAAEREVARRFIEHTFAGHDLWGWKDPRNCLTLPFWQRLMPEMRYVICLRNPVDVAASLERREGMQAEEAFELWRTYVSAALDNTEGRPRLFISYDEYFGDWRPPVGRLVRFATASSPDEDSWRTIEGAIHAGQRHHRTAAEAVLEDDSVPPRVRDLYLSTLNLAGAPPEAQLP